MSVRVGTGTKADVCACGKPFSLLEWKSKRRVMNAKGVLMTVSKKQKSLRCLDCTEPSSSQVKSDKNPNNPTEPRKGGGFKQKRLGDYFVKVDQA